VSIKSTKARTFSSGVGTPGHTSRQSAFVRSALQSMPAARDLVAEIQKPERAAVPPLQLQVFSRAEIANPGRPT
jgi:hypothetical protein